MKRLLLASSGIGALPSLVGGETAGLRFAFVPTAAGPEPDSKSWVQADRRQAEALGLDLTTLELASASAHEVEEALADVDGVFVTGGSSFLLLCHAQRSSFAELVVPRVESADLLYVGTSAGAVLAGPELLAAASVEERPAMPGLASSHALGLVDFSVLPHDQDPERTERNTSLVAAHPERRFVRLADDRAVVVRGDEVKVVHSPHLPVP